MNETTAEQAIKEKFKGNLQIIIAFGTVVGLAVGLGNFFILTALSPIESRVKALESRVHASDVLSHEFGIVKEKVERIDKNVEKIADRMGIIVK